MTKRGVLLCALACAVFPYMEACGSSNDSLFAGQRRKPDAGVDVSPDAQAGGTECKNSLDCVGATNGRQVCDRASGTCVECVMSADCNAGTSCYSGHCRAACVSDKDCTAMGLLCDTSAGHCVECVLDTDCADQKVCSAGSCETEQRPGSGGETSSGGRTGGRGANDDGGVSSGGTRSDAGLSEGGATASSGGTDGSGGAGGADETGGAKGDGGASATGGVEDDGGANGSGGVKGDGGAGGTSGGASAGTAGAAGAAGSGGAKDVGGTCLGSFDCASSICEILGQSSSGTCSAATTCSNGMRDGTETDVDCGGGACTKCAMGKACNANSDCTSSNCGSHVCTACDATKCPKPAAGTACCVSNTACGMAIGTLCF